MGHGMRRGRERPLRRNSVASFNHLIINKLSQYHQKR